MPISNITALPAAPSRADPDNFSSKGDAWISALTNTTVNEINSAITGMNTVQTTASAAATSAATSASAATAASTAASAAASAVAWVNGNTYTLNVCAISQVNFQTYRKKTASSVTTIDPANDGTNWRIVAGGVNAAFVPFAMPATDIDLSQGSPFFTVTINANTTFTISNCPPGGYSFTLELTHTSGSVTLPTSVKTPYDNPLQLTTGKTHLFMFVTSNGGTRWRLVPAPNFTT